MACGALAVLLALSACSLITPVYAYAAQEKHAVPAITKAVSLDAKTFSEQVTAMPGQTVYYRLRLTMPEGVENLKSVTYTVRDAPNKSITVDPKSVSAHIVDKDGGIKKRLSFKVHSTRGKFSLALGDVKKACPDVTFYDSVIVDYAAKVSSSAKKGSYPNVAKLEYDVGDGNRETAEVMAKVLVGDAGKSGGSGSSGGSKIAKTGDGLMAVSAGCAALAAVSGLGLACARRKRD